MTTTGIAATADPTPTRLRSPLGLVAGSLLLAQVVHLAIAQLSTTPQAHHATPGKLAHVAGIVGAIAVLASVLRRRPRAATYAAIAGALTAAGAVVLHVVPLDSHYTSPYWGEVSAAPWATVVAVVAAGLGSTLVAARHVRS